MRWASIVRKTTLITIQSELPSKTIARSSLSADGLPNLHPPHPSNGFPLLPQKPTSDSIKIKTGEEISTASKKKKTLQDSRVNNSQSQDQAKSADGRVQIRLHFGLGRLCSSPQLDRRRSRDASTVMLGRAVARTASRGDEGSSTRPRVTLICMRRGCPSSGSIRSREKPGKGRDGG